ncbi:hypothetical protein J6590_061182 [Homalodisca vitripennis]|nr:hypothetical protein J6590_061182 [Homalodisca vitripennis]
MGRPLSSWHALSFWLVTLSNGLLIWDNRLPKVSEFRIGPGSFGVPSATSQAGTEQIGNSYSISQTDKNNN